MNRFLFVGMLDSDEFALAMHLMNIKLDGQFIEDIHTNRRTDGRTGGKINGRFASKTFKW